MTSNKLVKWNQSVDYCSWSVTCHEGRVIVIDLTNESISGGLDDSSSLFNLQDLRSLSLAYNNFNSSQIPSQFDKLANLSYLNLSNSGFAGQIPVAISRLTRLVTFDLSGDYNLFDTGHFLLTLENSNLNMLIQNLSKLMELYLDGIAISAQGKEWCHALSSSLPNLRVLSLSNCNLWGPIDSSLRNLSPSQLFIWMVTTFLLQFQIFLQISKNWHLWKSPLLCWMEHFQKNIFQVPTLQTIELSYNYDLRGSLPEFPPNVSLRTMVLTGTNFSGTLQHSIVNNRYSELQFQWINSRLIGEPHTIVHFGHVI